MRNYACFQGGAREDLIQVHSRKETARFGGDEGDTVRVCPIIDLKLLAQAGSAENHDLSARFSNRIRLGR